MPLSTTEFLDLILRLKKLMQPEYNIQGHFHLHKLIVASYQADLIDKQTRDLMLARVDYNINN